MSRIGKRPVVIPAGTQVTQKEGMLVVKGAKGELKRSIPQGITVSLQSGQASVQRANDSRELKALHGLMRAHLANMVKGVTEGFVRQLEINGVGYRAEVVGNQLNLSLGLSHPVEYTLPAGIQAKSEKTKSTVSAGQDAVLLTLTGYDREAIGRFASQIRENRKSEPYKGKGIKYLEEKIKRKVGKTGAS